MNTKGAPKTHPSPNAFAHAVLRTNPDSYDKMVQFYIEVLSAEITHQAPTITFLRYDEEHHRIAIIKSPDYLPKVKGSIHAEVDHLAFSYNTLTALAQTYSALKAKAKPLLPLWSVNHGPTTSLYYRDPNGNKVELQVDNFDTVEAADTFMKGPLFEMNPLGTDLEVDDWAAEILDKVKPDGSEGLSLDDVKRIKTRREIGERFTMPVGLA